MNRYIKFMVMLCFTFLFLGCGHETSKETLIIQAKSYEGIYNGELQKISGFKNESKKGIKVADKNGVTYYVTGISSEYEGKNVSDSTKQIPIKGEAIVKNKDGDDYSKDFEVKVEYGSFKIKPAKLSLKSKNISKVYDGTPLKNNDEKLDIETGWKGNDGATYKFTASQKEIGSCSNTFEIIPNDGTDLDNYKITKSEGKLTVKKLEKKYNISIQANGLTCVYDGKEHSVSGFENMDGRGNIMVIVDQHVYYVKGLKSEAKGINVSDSVKNIKITGTPVVVNEDGMDVTQMFTISLHQASFIIKPANVLLESASISKEYDGLPLINGDHIITEQGWVFEEGATYTFTGKQEDVGSSTNSFSYQLKSNTKEENYVITKKEGTLTITDVTYDLTVKGLSYTGTYDGTVHEVNGFENMDESGRIVALNGSKTFYISGLVSYCSSKDACHIMIPISGSASVVDENGNDMTSHVNIHIENGVFEIYPISILLRSGSMTFEYDGVAHKYEVMDKNDGWMASDGVLITFDGEITEIGECENTFSFVYNDATNPSNYIISKEFGTLTVVTPSN